MTVGGNLGADSYLVRLDALEQTWRVWAKLGDGLTESQWRAPTRCAGWDVAALYAHHSFFPKAMDTSIPAMDTVGDPVKAVDIIRRFNAPDGVAHTMAESVADQAISDAASHTRAELVAQFSVHGPGAIQRLREADPVRVMPWGAAENVLTIAEALRIVLLEATVHLLDLQRALGLAPDVPVAALQDSARLLAELVAPIEFIEAATGRSTHSPFPVLR